MRRLIVFALLALALASSSLEAASSHTAGGAATRQNAASRTQVVLLGTGTPNADPERFGPSVAIVINDTPYIVDFGPGVVRRAAAAERNGVGGLAASKLKVAFATHLHSDHTTGLPDLIFTPWVLERKEPLEIYGPKGIKAMVAHVAAAYGQDVDIRLHGGEPSNKTGYRAIAHEIKPGVVYKDSNVTVKAFRVNHGAWREAYGYRFETADRVVVISGDCAPSESVVENCDGCDVLIHEVYSQTGFATRPPEWQRYHSRYHTSAPQLAGLASRARPRLLVLYHQLFWGTSEEDLLKEVQSLYKGRVASGRDLDVY